ncbi:MAG: cupin domain-containing protein [Candidatus Brocadia sp.]|nr:cupin domain-containing protein [Candidatus Brocadia sp.]
MLIKDLQNCKSFVAGDNAVLRELLHPDKEDVKLHYSLAHAVVKQGETSYRHKLKHAEVYYILEGKGIMYIDHESAEVRPGHAIYIQPNAIQCIRNIGQNDLKFLCIVEPAWRKEDEEIL